MMVAVFIARTNVWNLLLVILNISMIQFSSTTPRKVALPFINILPRGGVCGLLRSEGVVRLLTLPPAVLLRPVRGLFLNYCQLSTANLRLEFVACDFEHFHDPPVIHPTSAPLRVPCGFPTAPRANDIPPRSGLVFRVIANCRLSTEP